LINFVKHVRFQQAKGYSNPKKIWVAFWY